MSDPLCDCAALPGEPHEDGCAVLRDGGIASR